MMIILLTMSDKLRYLIIEIALMEQKKKHIITAIIKSLFTMRLIL